MILQKELIIDRLVEFSTSVYNARGLYGFAMDFPIQKSFSDYVIPRIREEHPDINLELVHDFYRKVIDYFHWFSAMHGKPNFMTFDETWKNDLRSKILNEITEVKGVRKQNIETKVV